MDEQQTPQTPANTPPTTPPPAQPIPIPPTSPTPPNSQPALPPETLKALGLGPTETPSSGGGAMGVVLSILGQLFNWIIVPIAIVLILHNFVFQAFHVVGCSMFPTLNDADYLIISKVGDTLSKIEHKVYVPERSQIIVFHYPKDPSLIFVKRVIALPGEHVVVRGGKAIVYNAQNPNGFEPDTSGRYTPSDPVTLGDYDDVVPAGNVFVMGDNRSPNGSFDSREWGTLPTSYIVGQASVRLLPLESFRFISNLAQPVQAASVGCTQSSS